MIYPSKRKEKKFFFESFFGMNLLKSYTFKLNFSSTRIISSPHTPLYTYTPILNLHVNFMFFIHFNLFHFNYFYFNLIIYLRSRMLLLTSMELTISLIPCTQNIINATCTEIIDTLSTDKHSLNVGPKIKK